MTAMDMASVAGSSRSLLSDTDVSPDSIPEYLIPILYADAIRPGCVVSPFVSIRIENHLDRWYVEWNCDYW